MHQTYTHFDTVPCTASAATNTNCITPSSASQELQESRESSVPRSHKFSGVSDLYPDLLKFKSVVCASPAVRNKLYKKLDEAGITYRTEFVEQNTDGMHGLGYAHTGRSNFSYLTIAKLIKGGRLTQQGLASAIYAFQEAAENCRGTPMRSLLEDFECDESYSSADFAPAFAPNLREHQIAKRLKAADPYPNQPFYPMWYARLVKSTKRIVIVTPSKTTTPLPESAPVPVQ